MPLLVTYERGAVSPGEIATGLADLGQVAFAVADSPHTRRVRPVLAALGPVAVLTGEFPADLARVRSLAPTAIVTFSELMLPATAALAAALGLPFPSVAATGMLTDKILQRERLRSCGVDDVRSHPVSSLDDWPLAREITGLPAVIKPVQGEGSRNTYLVRDDQSACRLLTSVLPAVRVVLAEELLQGRPGLPFGDYVSVESMCTPRGIRHLAITGKFPLAQPFRETGRFWPALVSAAERAQIEALVTRALQALRMTTGLTHTEVKLTAAGPRLIEVNGRLGGHVHGLAEQAAGVSMVRLAGQLALGRTPDPPAALDQPDRVQFQYNTLAPTGACTLLAAHGAAQVRRVAGIEGFRAYAKPGDVFGSDVMTRHLDLLWGSCGTHADMTGILEEALGQLSYEFRFPDRTERISASTQLNAVPPR